MNTEIHRLRRLVSGRAPALAAAFVALACSSAVAAPKKPARPAPASAAAVPSAPTGPEEPKAHDGISHVLGFLDWGATPQDVLNTLKKEVDARYAEMMREVRDPMEIDRALRRKGTEFAAIEKTLVQFSGQRTGYESSLIAQDFVPDNEESMIRVDDRDAQRYYFFKNDRLWKVLVAYSSSVSRSMSFADFVKQVQDKYGRPAGVDWATPKGGAKAMRAASWDDPITRLVVEDRTEFFGTYCMKFLDRAVGVPLEEERAKRAEGRPGVVSDASVDAALLEITSGPTSGDDSVVDRLTGREHSLDLAGNRPDYETTLNRGAPAASPTFPSADDGKKRKDKKGGGKGKAGKPDPKEARPAGGSGSAQPVIIY
ncbi:hypothetical protein L6V77_00320 [Myxococcota bacterium]|nr:hypothetical protein [Myxococcota bacterium]